MESIPSSSIVPFRTGDLHQQRTFWIHFFDKNWSANRRREHNKIIQFAKIAVILALKFDRFHCHEAIECALPSTAFGSIRMAHIFRASFLTICSIDSIHNQALRHIPQLRLDLRHLATTTSLSESSKSTSRFLLARRFLLLAIRLQTILRPMIRRRKKCWKFEEFESKFSTARLVSVPYN